MNLQLRLNYEIEFVKGIWGEIYNGYIFFLVFYKNECVYYVVYWIFDLGEVGFEKMEFYLGIFECCEFGSFFGICNYVQLIFIGFYVRFLVLNVMVIKGEEDVLISKW